MSKPRGKQPKPPRAPAPTPAPEWKPWHTVTLVDAAGHVPVLAAVCMHCGPPSVEFRGQTRAASEESQRDWIARHTNCGTETCPPPCGHQRKRSVKTRERKQLTWC